jgi:hypothetical protein
MSFMPASQVLFGTDSPFVPTEVTARGAPRSSLRVRVSIQRHGATRLRLSGCNGARKTERTAPHGGRGSSAASKEFSSVHAHSL